MIDERVRLGRQVDAGNSDGSGDDSICVVQIFLERVFDHSLGSGGIN